MKDVTLKFKDKQEYQNFLIGINWQENEELQDKLLLDEIGYTYTDTIEGDDQEPVSIRNDGYFVNVRILNFDFNEQIFDGYVVTLDQPLREWA
ncbi:hypothetical protein [Enterobacteria phage JenP1]|uniref:Uncharacterized protein n=1 Tax=Enterobacteria phage JenP1 TaxID=1610837 RepID=A0A0E3JSQ1_9CAUD|nr:hypothetical protein AVU34_gp24 [Enterobacteria phage JenP1]AKA60890.1 hypothetical protein [Enterobacteria phage JenP1]